MSDSESTSTELLACPFCGDDMPTERHSYLLLEGRNAYEVRCSNSGCGEVTMTAPSRAEATAKWNRRANAPLSRERSEMVVRNGYRNDEQGRRRMSTKETTLERAIRETDLKTIPWSLEITEVAGSFYAGLMLMQIMAEQNKPSCRPGWVEKSHHRWTEDLGIKANAQRRARKLLRDRGLIKEHKLGIDCTIFYKADVEEVLRQLRKVQDRRLEELMAGGL